jgi:hypothetical protein
VCRWRRAGDGGPPGERRCARGEDAEGALLLAVCPLPDPDVVEAAGVAHVSVTLEGGQTVALTLALGEGSNGEAPTYVLQLTYADPAPVVLLLPGPPP